MTINFLLQIWDVIKFKTKFSQKFGQVLRLPLLHFLLQNAWITFYVPFVKVFTVLRFILTANL